MKEEDMSEPTEVNLSYMREKMKQYNIPYAYLDNENIRKYLEWMDDNDNKSPNEHNIDSFFSKYSL
jgi:hypothetical protein